MGDLSFYETEPDKLLISSEADVLRIFEKFYPKQKLILYQINLSADFFDLSTGLAGQVLQKLVNYKVKTAFVIDLASVKSEKFREMVNEANMGEQFRFFARRGEAIEWLEN